MRRILKTAASLLTGLALTLSVAAATDLPANAASSCSTTLSSYGTVKSGTHGKKAKAAQCLLKSAGYSVKTDSSFSKADARALKSFQAKHKLSQTGKVNKSTWVALLSRGSKPRLSYGDTGSSVKRLQRALKAAGYNFQVTGYYGPITKAAVKSVQRSQGWRATGVATTGVWKALQAGGGVKVKVAKAAKKKTTKKKASTTSSAAKGLKALAFAKKQLGDSYRYGARGPNAWDCSGLTGGSWKAAGVKLPRTSQAQYRFGKKVSKSDLRKGDLVFFYSGISHVAIYAGNGKVIHASRPGKPVGYIKMKYMPYAGARRPA